MSQGCNDYGMVILEKTNTNQEGNTSVPDEGASSRTAARIETIEPVAAARIEDETLVRIQKKKNDTNDVDAQKRSDAAARAFEASKKLSLDLAAEREKAKERTARARARADTARKEHEEQDESEEENKPETEMEPEIEQELDFEEDE